MPFSSLLLILLQELTPVVVGHIGDIGEVLIRDHFFDIDFRTDLAFPFILSDFNSALDFNHNLQ